MKKVILIMIGIAVNVAALADSVVDAAVEFIIREESFSATPYTCPGGKVTIGYGCTDKEVVARGKITKAEAEVILRKRVEKEIRWLHQELPKLTDCQLVAVTSLVFNIGRTRFLKSKAYQCLKAGYLLRAVMEMQEFRLSKGKVCKGLVARRQRERNLFLGC